MGETFMTSDTAAFKVTPDKKTAANIVIGYRSKQPAVFMNKADGDGVRVDDLEALKNRYIGDHQIFPEISVHFR